MINTLKEEREAIVEQVLLKCPVAQEVCTEDGKCIPDAIYISGARKAFGSALLSHEEKVMERVREVVDDIKDHANRCSAGNYKDGMLSVCDQIKNALILPITDESI